MAVFTALATSIATAIGVASTTFISATAFALQVVTGIGLSYAARALSGSSDQSTESQFGVQGKLSAGADVPRAFMLGSSLTAGSLVYANTWGQTGQDTPNAFLFQVIALSDLPVGGGNASLKEFWCNGEKCTINWSATDTGLGYPVNEYFKEGYPHLYVKFYDGTQTAADSFLSSPLVFGAHPTHPYGADRIAKGITYAIVTAVVNDGLFSGFPQYKFALKGIPLYDVSKDTTAGGDGPQRWADPSTWGGDGDDYPAVQIYNLLRGISYGGQWLYGLQNLAAARLPAADWIAQINKCRAAVDIGGGDAEPAYRTGLQVNVSSQPADIIQAILTGCQGKLAEMGGIYKIRLGAPEAAVLTVTDGDILSTEEQSFTPFFGLASTINGISGRYPDPAQGWETQTAPPLYNAEFEAQDGARRLMADVSFDAVPYSVQVQRLMKSALEEARRARRHTFTLPPSCWLLEPGDIFAYSSDRNGYDSKLFRVDGISDKANLDILVDCTEVDPSDYDWEPGDYTPVVVAPIIISRPAPQPIIDWFAQGAIINDDDGLPRRPAIMLSWDGNKQDVVGVAFEVRKYSDGTVVHRGRTDNPQAGSILISQNLLPNMNYEARGRYLTNSPRDTLWSDWLGVTTPDVNLSLVEFNAGIKERVTEEIDSVQEIIDWVNAKLASLGSINTARNWLDKKEQRRELASVYGKANARITEVWTVATNTEAALAQTTLELEAGIEEANSRITITNTALSTLTESVSQQTQNFISQFGTVNGRIDTEIVTRSTETGALSARIDTLSASTNNSFASVNQSLLVQANQIGAISSSLTTLTTTVNGHTSQLSIIGASIDGVKAQYGVLITIDGQTGGYVFSGIKKLDGTVSYELAIKGNVIVDGSITASKIGVGQVTAVQIAAGSIDAYRLAAGAVTADKISAGAITADKIQANQIDASKITVGGVSLENLAVGAATNEGWAEHPGRSVPPNTTLTSVTLEIKSSRAFVSYTAIINASNTVTGFVTVKIDVDGVERKSWTLTPFQIGGAFVISTPITPTAMIGGLAAGGHTFAIRIYDVLGNTTVSDGVLRVQDLRR